MKDVFLYCHIGRCKLSENKRSMDLFLSRFHSVLVTYGLGELFTLFFLDFFFVVVLVLQSGTALGWGKVVCCFFLSIFLKYRPWWSLVASICGFLSSKLIAVVLYHMFFKTDKQQGFVSYRVGIMDFYKAVNKAEEETY